ncbi:DsbA family protein [Brevirhabdus sp.]|uniref:DsbA family protein n=1 Tax=Brevirhabdus sp. TaxID=2004514 RepID=UPI004059E41B
MAFTTLKAAATALLLAASAMSFAPGAALAQSGTDTPAQTPAPTQTQTPQVVEMTLGQTEAPVEVIEYASFTCPHCQRFHAEVFDDLKKDYIDTGKIRFVYREVYFDRYGLWAGMVARCGGPEKYFGIVDMIYDTQKQWLQSGEPVEISNSLKRLGRTAGIPEDKLSACLKDEAKAKAMVATYQQNATADGIDSTPSFVIDGTKYNNMAYADFKEILDAQLAK